MFAHHHHSYSEEPLFIGVVLSVFKDANFEAAVINFLLGLVIVILRFVIEEIKKELDTRKQG